MNNGKIVLVDYGAIMFTAIFSQKYCPSIPLGYNITNIILGNLLKVGIEPEDDIIIAIDKGKSWRKMYEASYKADRKEKREKNKDIDWDSCFKQSDSVLEHLNYATNWTFLASEGLEADDWASYVVRYYKDRECVLVSFDSDWEILLAFPNVKVFSPKSKKYKFNDNPYKTLAQKINKETSDNLINPVMNESDFEKRNICVNLLSLPDFVEGIMKEQLDALTFDKSEHLDAFPFVSLKEKYINLINDKSKVVTIEKCKKSIERKKKKGKKKCTK